MLKVLINILIAGAAGQLSLPASKVSIPLANMERNVLLKEERPRVLGVAEVRGPEKINRNTQGLKLSAKSALAIDGESGKVLFSKNANKRLPVASISKLVSALVFLDTEPDLEKVVYMQGSDYVGGASLRVGVGESLRIKDLLYASLISSSNNAVSALVRSTGMNDKEFMIAMNTKARGLGMIDTYFAEPTGLNMVNHSTALDVAKLMKAVLDREEILQATKLREYTFRTINTGRSVRVISTDKLLSTFLNKGEIYEVLGGKTGYTSEAGYCLTAAVRGPQNQEIVIVVLGTESDRARFQEVKGLAWWVLNNWQW